MKSAAVIPASVAFGAGTATVGNKVSAQSASTGGAEGASRGTNEQSGRRKNGTGPL